MTVLTKMHIIYPWEWASSKLVLMKEIKTNQTHWSTDRINTASDITFAEHLL